MVSEINKSSSLHFYIFPRGPPVPLNTGPLPLSYTTICCLLFNTTCTNIKTNTLCLKDLISTYSKIAKRTTPSGLRLTGRSR